MRGIEAESSLAGLTIRTSSPASSSSKKGKDLLQTNSASDSSPSIKNSPFSSPSLVSPPSSAFVSALQSPYISPRATQPITTVEKNNSNCGGKGKKKLWNEEDGSNKKK